MLLVMLQRVVSRSAIGATARKGPSVMPIATLIQGFNDLTVERRDVEGVL